MVTVIKQKSKPVYSRSRSDRFYRESRNSTPYASFGLRLLAFGVDGLILGVVVQVVSFVTGIEKAEPVFQLVPKFDSVSSIMALVILWAYFVLTTKYFAGTFGKLAFGLEVRRADGKPLDWTTVILREVIGKTISTITGLLGFLWISWDVRKQGFHDKIADTVVVKV